MQSAMAGALATSSKSPSKKGGKAICTAEEMNILQQRAARIQQQRSVQLQEIGVVRIEKLGDSSIVSPRYLDMNIFLFVKIGGLPDLFHQDWETLYMVAQKEVYVPLIKEFSDCAVIVNRDTIRTRANYKIITVTLNDMAEALNVRLDEGEIYYAIWDSKVNDSRCIWKDVKEPLCVEVSNVIDECKFNNVVFNKVLLPKEGARNHVNAHARYALYKIHKRVKVNPAYLIWNYLIKFLEKEPRTSSFRFSTDHNLGEESSNC